MPQDPPPDFSPPSGWNPFVVGAIAVLVTIFLLLSYYKMMKIQCSSIIEAPIIAYRSERRRFNEDNPNEPSLQFHSRGLDSSIIQCLPTIQYTAKKGDGETEHGETECAVCLDDFEVGDMLRLLPNCAHSFHMACIDTWFKSHSNCPLCRSNILYSASDHRSYSVSVFTSLETHRREDVIREIGGGGSSHESLQNSRVRPPLQHIPFPSIGLF